MQFNTIGFLVFFIVVLGIYYLVQPIWRWAVLLAASLFFYAELNAPHLLIALALVTLISYSLGRVLTNLSIDSFIRKGVLWIGVLLNLAVLVAIRCLTAFVQSQPTFFLPTFALPNLIVSIGVSFYVLQAISYLVDIYYNELSPELHFGYFSLYISFFPKLLQGPIERASDLLPQLHKPKSLTKETIRSALLLFAWGLFKKVVVADRLAILVGAVYDHLPGYRGFSLWLATFYYALQIYCDFSGYTDMAIGVARLLGINLNINFNKPYLAISIADFWRRWHISFSNWILDYIFKPLQMELRKWKTWANPVALLITFFLSGIWHGASWGFMVWGLLHGCYMAAYVLLSPYEKKVLHKYKLEKSKVLRALHIGLTFFLVCFAWIFFRANTLADGWYVVSHLFTDLTYLTNAGQTQGLLSPFTFNLSWVDLVSAALGVSVLLVVELPQNLAMTWMFTFFQKHTFLRWVGIGMLIVLSLFWVLLIFTSSSPSDPFIYQSF